MKKYRIEAMGADGIGPEVIGACVASAANTRRPGE
jgi:isocitrate/isopropylmalate dehydrogenase